MPTDGGLLVVAALTDPVGADRGHELVTLVNTTASTVELAGWTLADAAGGRQNLIGTLPAGGVLQLTAGGAVQLGNQGDSLVLIDLSGATVDQVAYTAKQVRAGRTICFGR